MELDGLGIFPAHQLQVIAVIVKLLIAGALVAGAPHSGDTLTVVADGFANCTALHNAYPHGVGKPGAVDKVSGKTQPVTIFARNASVYADNSNLDRDRDGIACEKI